MTIKEVGIQADADGFYFYRDLKILLAIYSAAHLPMLAFFDARFWDDWSLYKAAPETLLNVFGQGGSPWVGYLHIGVQQVGWWAYPALTFLAFFVTVVCAYKVSINLSIGSSSFWIAAFVAVIPVNYARIAAISLPSTLLLTVFMLSWLALLSLNENNRFWVRLVALVGFFVSFQVGSLIVFYILPFSTYFFIRLKQNTAKNKNYWLGVVPSVIDFAALPFVYWYVKSTYFKPSGMFSDGYNIPAINLSTFVKPILSILDFFSGSGVAIGSGGILVVALLTLITSRISRVLPRFDGKGLRQGFFFIFIGVLVSYIGVFPYAAVGKLPSFSDWTQTRHQFLLMFGLAITFFGVISCCVRNNRVEGCGTAKLLPMFFVLLFVGNWWQIYSEFYVDSLKQRALIALMKRSPVAEGGNLIILDNTKLSAFSTHSGLGEYAGIHAEARSLHNTLILDYQSVGEYSGWGKFIEIYAKFFGVWSKTDRVNLELKPSFYILNSTVNLSDGKLKYSIEMLLMRIFREKKEAETIENSLSLDGPFSMQPGLLR